MILGVETGGTKILWRLVDGNRVVRNGRCPTTTSEEGVRAILADIDVPVQAVGVAAFGPVVVDPAAADRGTVLETVKPGWTGSNLARTLADALGCPFAVDSDVNAAALAEGQGLPGSTAYLTVGTGLGGGLARDGRTLAGALHPEVGHLPVRRLAGDDGPSTCPFHPSCAEGLAAGPAVRRRIGPDAALADVPEVAGLVAGYLGQLCAMLVLAWSPHRIVLGGGVGTTPGLAAATHAAMLREFNGYGVGPACGASDFIVPPRFEDAGLEGALLMARRLQSP